MKSIKNIKKRIESINAVFSNAVESAKIAIYDIVSANGGFIFVDDNGDSIYGYALDDDDILQEYRVKALRTTADGDVEVFLAPILRSCQVVYTEDYLKNETDEDEWYPISGADGSLYSLETVISIIESINQYSKN